MEQDDVSASVDYMRNRVVGYVLIGDSNSTTTMKRYKWRPWPREFIEDQLRIYSENRYYEPLSSGWQRDRVMRVKEFLDTRPQDEVVQEPDWIRTCEPLNMADGIKGCFYWIPRCVLEEVKDEQYNAAI